MAFDRTDSEADTSREYVLPRLYAAGWTGDMMTEQKTFADGRKFVAGRKVVCPPRKRADYLFRHSLDFTLVIVEIKAGYKKAVDALERSTWKRLEPQVHSRRAPAIIAAARGGY